MVAERDTCVEPESRETAVSTGVPPSAIRVRATVFWVQDAGLVVKNYHPKSTTNNILEMNSWRKALSRKDAMRGGLQRYIRVLKKGVRYVTSIDPEEGCFL